MLRKLTLKDEKKYMAYIKAWKDEDIVPHALDANGLAYDLFIDQLNMREQGLYEPKTNVPDELYVMVNQQDDFIGVISLRAYLNEHLLAYDGHIGYGIHPKHRKKGYAKVMLKLALDIYKKRQILKVLVTCNEENIASKKVIESCHGVLENKVYKTDGYILRYWISLSD